MAQRFSNVRFSSHTPPVASRTSSGGQSILEILIAVAIGAVLFIGAASLVAPILKTNTATRQVQTGAAVGKQLMDNVKVWSEGNWNNALNLATSSINIYYLITSSSPFIATSGIESILVSTTTFTRYFYLDDVYRDGSGYVTSTASGNTYDPSTKQATVIYNWTRGVTTTLIEYLTRNATVIYDQTDWSGGSGFNGPATTTDARFSASVNIAY